jgi:hypothetical protein
MVLGRTWGSWLLGRKMLCFGPARFMTLSTEEKGSGFRNANHMHLGLATAFDIQRIQEPRKERLRTRAALLWQ